MNGLQSSPDGGVRTPVRFRIGPASDTASDESSKGSRWRKKHSLDGTVGGRPKCASILADDPFNPNYRHRDPSDCDVDMEDHHASFTSQVYRTAKQNVKIILIFSAQFISSRGNEYFCEIDEDYLTDRFNLTGLNTEVQYYQYALDLVTDVFDMEVDDDMREQIEKSARHLYGLVHARYVVTTRGLAKMVCSALTLPR